MNINHEENIIYRLSELTENDLPNVDLTFHLFRIQKESDDYFQSTSIQLAPDVIHWLKKSIIYSLNELKSEDETGRRVFLVGDYNHEIQLNDRIARMILDDEDRGLREKLTRLMESLRNPDPEYSEKHTRFQVVKLTSGDQDAYFCYYRGVKKNSVRSPRKKKIVMKNANLYVFAEDTIIDLGGKIDFFIVDNNIFIVNVQSFEYAFDYRDHITERRDRNIEQIVSMPFFDGIASNRDAFQEACKKHLYSRTLAQISPETMAALQANFDERCNELSHIRANEPQDPREKERYMAKYSSIWGLFDHIDLENRKVIYHEGASPKPLIHFFADKIVKSFLTEDYKVAIAYEQQ